MIVGSKKWWFIPPSQTAYLKPSINVNGFSAHTRTLVGKNGEIESPWMKKLERYTAVLHPGDVLINPPWFWHGILNQGLRHYRKNILSIFHYVIHLSSGEHSNDLVIGCPTRFQGAKGLIAAVRSNPFLTASAFSVIIKNAISNGFRARGDLEDKIQANRVARMQENDP